MFVSPAEVRRLRTRATPNMPTRRFRCAIERCQQPLDDLPERLPGGIPLPHGFAPGAKPLVRLLELTHPVGEPLDPADLVRRLEQACDDDAAAGRHGADVRGGHLQAMDGVT